MIRQDRITLSLCPRCLVIVKSEPHFNCKRRRLSLCRAAQFSSPSRGKWHMPKSGIPSSLRSVLLYPEAKHHALNSTRVIIEAWHENGRLEKVKNKRAASNGTFPQASRIQVLIVAHPSNATAKTMIGHSLEGLARVNSCINCRLPFNGAVQLSTRNR